MVCPNLNSESGHLLVNLQFKDIWSLEYIIATEMLAQNGPQSRHVIVFVDSVKYFIS